MKLSEHENYSDKKGSGLRLDYQEKIKEPLNDGDYKLCPIWLRITDSIKEPSYRQKTHKTEVQLLLTF